MIGLALLHAHLSLRVRYNTDPGFMTVVICHHRARQIRRGCSCSTRRLFPPFIATKKSQRRKPLSLLLADTDGSAAAASGLGVLSTDTQTPVVTQTPVGTNLLQSLQIITELAVNSVGKHLAILAIDNVTLSVQEPGWDLVLGWVLEDGDDALEFFGGKFTGAVVCGLVRVHDAHSMVGREISCVWSSREMYRLLRSTSAFLQTKLEYRRPTPLILVMAYMTFSFPSTC